MKIARQYDFHFFDGQRKYGYGGYKYLEGYWSDFSSKLIKLYTLDRDSKVLDIGCAKGYMLVELGNLVNSHNHLYGFDISVYALENSHPAVKSNLDQYDLNDLPLPYENNQFDLVVSLNTLHNLDIREICKALKEISRISINSYIVVEAYDSEENQSNMYNWALTAKTLISKDAWRFLFELTGYNGDYEFITFE